MSQRIIAELISSFEGDLAGAKDGRYNGENYLDVEDVRVLLQGLYSLRDDDTPAPEVTVDGARYVPELSE